MFSFEQRLSDYLSDGGDGRLCVATDLTRRADVLDLHVSAFDADINGRRLMAASARRVAVLDLDDTLVRGDSFGQFTRGLSTGRVTAAPRSRCTFCGP